MIVSNIIDITKEKFRIKSILNTRMLKTLFIILCGLQFYRYYALSGPVLNSLSTLSILLIVAFSYKKIFCKVKNKYYKTMQWLLFSLLACMVMAWIFWGQSLLLTYRAAQSFLLLIFFYFVANKFKVTELERIIIIFGWLYVILWLYALYKVPDTIFGNAQDEIDKDELRGFFRINFTGRLSMILAYFLYLCKYFVHKKNKYIVYAAVLFTFIVFQLTRQLILWTAVISLIYIFLSSKKWAIILALVFGFLYAGSYNIQFSDDSVIGSLINITNMEMNGQLYAGENPRIVEYRYLFTQWSPNLLTDIFGTGIDCGSDTAYGKYVYKIGWSKGIYITDIGYGHMFAQTGILGLGLYVWLFIICTFSKMPKELQYVNMFMGAMIPLNIAAAWYAGADTKVCIAICVYLIYRYGYRSKRVRIPSDNSSQAKLGDASTNK